MTQRSDYAPRGRPPCGPWPWLASLLFAVSGACHAEIGMQARGSGGAGATGMAGTTGTTGAAGTTGAGGARAGTGGNADAGTPRDAAAIVDARAPGDAPSTISTDGGVWHLVWSDEFDVDGAPSAASWSFERGFVRNQELQWYQPDNARVANGILTIAAQKVHIANPNYQAGSTDWKRSRQFYDYTSTSMTTSGKHTFTYGRFEARARIDVRQGSWPAFWVVGTSGGWPAGGEVDIMEFYASKVLANVCKPAGSDCSWSSKTKAVSTLGAGWADQFHVWAMEWDATRIDLFLDDVLVNHFNVADAVAAGTTNPYVGRPLYMIVNLALGGTNGGDPADTPFPISYEIDYVRVYQR
jgi:beta-glucanase (GH16 family)